MKTIPFDTLQTSDLIVDAIYEGGKVSNTSSDAISKILPGVGNLGGFRASGKGENKNFIVLYTSGEDPDWPDSLDLNTGQFIYYGDNKKPGHELHETQPGGNKILRTIFRLLHSGDRSKIPAIFVFQKHPTKNSGRSVQFKGLAVPGFPSYTATEDLVAIWKSTNGQRFQNYRAVFSVLDIPVISRAWLKDILTNNSFSSNAPKLWLSWVSGGRYSLLTAEPTTIIRSLQQQFPDSESKISVLKIVWDYFKDTPVEFENFAAKIFQMHDQRVIIDKVTRSSVDGGRDAIGRYLLGLKDDPVYAEFSIEAKCYRPALKGSSPNTVGVKEVARLISRIRHRQFGVLVTTSAIARQAYDEVRSDNQPIIFISGKDITDILVKNGYNTPKLVSEWLQTEFG